MKNRKNEYFQVNCSINYGQDLILKLPYTVHKDFECTVDSGNEDLMARLVELFAEYELLDKTKCQTFQALILERKDKLSTIDDLLNCMKAVRLCTALLDGEKSD